MDTHGRADFTGKVVFVTGAASGIGRAAALAFAHEGASVVVADVSEQGNQQTARMIEAQGGRALAVRCDVTRAADVKAALDKTVEAFGRLDFAFNNAGIEPRKPAPTAEYEEEEWNRIIDTNLRSVFLCMKHEIPLILKQGGGAIVNTSSGAGIIGIKGSPAYTAAKHGVIGLTCSGPRLRCAEHPRQRRLPRVHRHRDDGSLHRGHARRAREGDRGGAGRADGQARGDRRGRPLAVLGRGRLYGRPRHGDRRRPDDTMIFAANGDAIAVNATGVEITPGCASAFIEGATKLARRGDSNEQSTSELHRRE